MNNGGAAFPSSKQVEVYDEHKAKYVKQWWPEGGMTLRDYFAGQVISQCQITVTREEPPPDAELLRVYAERYARTAYAIADAMLAQREIPAVAA